MITFFQLSSNSIHLTLFGYIFVFSLFPFFFCWFSWSFVLFLFLIFFWTFNMTVQNVVSTAAIRRVNMRSWRGVLLWERCIQCMYRFAHNFDKSPVEVVPTLTIFVKDLYMTLKRKKLGPIADLIEGWGNWPWRWPWRPREKKSRVPLASYRRGRQPTPQKRKHANQGSSSTPKKGKGTFCKTSWTIYFLLFWYHRTCVLKFPCALL